MKRWLRRILATLLIVIVLAIAITQIVLWTDYPRALVLRLVQQQLGLRVEAASLSTGWFGSTTLSDVKVSLPLADDSFLVMPTMEVEHTSLIPLLFTRKFELSGIELRKPDVVVQRDANGRWNFQDVAELLLKAGGGGAAEPGTKKRPPRLPRLRVTDATVNVHEYDGRKLVIAPVNVIGDPQGPLVYRYDAAAGSPKRLTAVGLVSPGENWKHEVKIFAEPGDWLTPWMKNPPSPLVLNGDWAGVVHEGRIIGRLVIADAKYEKFGARGRVMVQAGRSDADAAAGAGGAGGARAGALAIVNPQDLVLTTSMATVPELRLASGAIEILGSTLKAKQIRVSALGGSAQVDGSGDFAAQSAELKATWLELPAPRQIQHSGELTMSVRTPFPGGPQVDATLVTRGAANEGKWTGEVRVNGAGRGWDDMTWVVNAKQLNWDAKYSFGVNDFTARLRHLGQQITLASVEWPGHQVTASGWYHTGDRSWSLRMNGRDTATTDATGQTPFDFNVDARGDAKQVRLNELLLRAQEVELKASGLYDGHIPRPFDFEFLVTHEGPPPAPAAASPPASARATSPADEPPIRGRLFAEGRINGTQSPVNLDITGFLRTRNLVVLGREYGDIKGTITGSVKEADAWSAQFNVRDLSLFGGQWHITSVFPYTGKDRLTSGGGEPLRAKIVASGLKLKDLGDLLRTPLDGGDATGDFLIDIPFPGARGDTAAMSGTFGAKNVVLGEGGNERFRADEITGQMSLKHGVFRADPIKLRRAERDVSGDATLSVQTTLTDLKRPTVTLAAKTWPVKTGDAMAAVTADANLSVDVAKKSASGPIKARATFATTQRGIGEANVDAQIDGRVAVFRKITLDAIGGHAEGSGTIDADDPNRSTLTMSWSDIEGERLADLLPHFRGLTGAYSGAISLAPASADRALEPLRLTAGVTPVEGKFRAMEVGAMKFSAYLNLGKNFMLERIVLDAAPDEIRQAQRREAELDARKVALRDRPLDWNDIRIADGRIRLWARRGRHESAAQVQTHLIADFQNLDIDQLVHAMKPKSDAMPGRISGSMTIHGNPYDRDLVLGQGRVDITESDLANVDALALLYNATQLGHSTTQPTGNGSLELSLQASKLSLQNIRYFNRGIQARSSSIDIAEIWNMPDSKIFGFIVGSARPLKDLKLPLLADVDQILNIVQSGLTTVRIEGTVAEPKVKLVPFGEVNEALKRFIVGEVKNETRGE